MTEIKEVIEKLEEALRQYLPECDISEARFLHQIIVKDCIDQALAKLRTAQEHPPAGEFERHEAERKAIFGLLNKKQLPIVGGMCLDGIVEDLVEKFESSEASRKELLTACDEGLHECERVKINCTCGHKDLGGLLRRIERIEAAIKSNKEGGE